MCMWGIAASTQVVLDRWKLSPSMTMQHLHIPERVLACMEWHEHFLGKDYEWEMWNTAFIKLHMETQDAASTSPINNLVAFASWLNKTAQWRYMYRKVPTERSPKLQRYPVKNTGWAILRVRCEKVKKSGPTVNQSCTDVNQKSRSGCVSCSKSRHRRLSWGELPEHSEELKLLQF